MALAPGVALVPKVLIATDVVMIEAGTLKENAPPFATVFAPARERPGGFHVPYFTKESDEPGMVEQVPPPPPPPQLPVYEK